jgi:hypothetical protein
MLKLAAALALLLSAPLIAPAGNGCSQDSIIAGGCGVADNGRTIDISGTRSHLERDSRFSPIGDDSDTSPAHPKKEFNFDECLVDWDRYKGCFRARADADPAEDGTAVPAIPAITLTDLAQFAPSPVAAFGEPDNLGVAGMPTNFVAAASAHTRSGTVFAIPVTVRFTPVGFDFRYGDGDAATTTTGGRTWSTLGQASFTPTATSHIYRERGTYDASLTVRYTAEVDLGVGWFPVEGQLSIDGPTQQIRIFEAHTALVARTCVEQPSAPGC